MLTRTGKKIITSARARYLWQMSVIWSRFNWSFSLGSPAVSSRFKVVSLRYLWFFPFKIVLTLYTIVLFRLSQTALQSSNHPLFLCFKQYWHSVPVMFFLACLDLAVGTIDLDYLVFTRSITVIDSQTESCLSAVKGNPAVSLLLRTCFNNWRVCLQKPSSAFRPQKLKPKNSQLVEKISE